jgi:hypothetical protein
MTHYAVILLFIGQIKTYMDFLRDITGRRGLSCRPAMEKCSCLFFVFLLTLAATVNGQIDNTGCVGANFGIDADFYSGLLQFGTHGAVSATGTTDWFQGSTGRGIIDETNKAAIQTQLQTVGNPALEVRMSYPIFSRVDNRLWIDAVYGRDYFGGTGYTDATSYTSSAKNAQDPGI